MYKKDKQKAFTLVELLVVIAIIGLLSTIILITTKGLKDRATITKTLVFSRQIENTLGVDLVGRWNFDEGEGNIAYDSSGWGNDGILISNSTWTDNTPSGKGYALNVNGATQYVKVSNSSSLQVTGDLTLELWVYPKDYAAKRQNLICKTYGGELCITAEIDSSIKFYCGTSGTDSSPYISSSWPIDTQENNKWIHLVVVKNIEDSTIVLYKNGTVSRTTNCGDSCIAKESIHDFKIGHGYAGSFNGLIDEVKIYEKSLTLTEIQYEYYAGLDRLLAKDLINQKEHQDRLVLR